MGDTSAVTALYNEVTRPLADAGPVLTETLDAYLDSFERAREAGIAIVDSDDERLSKMSGGPRHQGVVARVTALKPRHSLPLV